jgi:hypothetical protein
VNGDRIDCLARFHAAASSRRGIVRVSVASLMASGLASLGLISTAGAKNQINKIACREYTKKNYPPCIAGSAAL